MNKSIYIGWLLNHSICGAFCSNQSEGCSKHRKKIDPEHRRQQVEEASCPLVAGQSQDQCFDGYEKNDDQQGIGDHEQTASTPMQ